MLFQPPKPGKFVIEPWARLRIAVREIETADEYALYGCFDVTGLLVGGIAGKRCAGQNGFAVSRQDRDAVPGLFSAPNCRIASLLDRGDRKVAFRTLQFLQANQTMVSRLVDAGLVRREPSDSDLRSWSLTLTPEGDRALRIVRRELEKLNARIRQLLSDDQFGAFNEALKVLAETDLDD